MHLHTSTHTPLPKPKVPTRQKVEQNQKKMNNTIGHFAFILRLRWLRLVDFTITGAQLVAHTTRTGVLNESDILPVAVNKYSLGAQYHHRPWYRGRLH